jgi:hypothetical protein
MCVEKGSAWDKPGEIERRDLAIECFHGYRVLLDVVKSA